MGSENVTDAQINDALTILNNNVNGQDADFTTKTPDVFAAVVGIPNIEFRLATKDPDGNPTSGINRVRSELTVESIPRDLVKSLSYWNSYQYLNIWVVKKFTPESSGGILLGYAQFPGGAASTDGVVMDYQYFGTIGTATAPFDLGRTATHEVGHWLNLRHIWGDGNCNADDFVSDTPSSDAANYGCASNHVSCSSTDMVQNYMDYSDDACMNLFTEGQKTRMRALFDTGGCQIPVSTQAGSGNVGGYEIEIKQNGTCPTCWYTISPAAANVASIVPTTGDIERIILKKIAPGKSVIPNTEYWLRSKVRHGCGDGTSSLTSQWSQWSEISKFKRGGFTIAKEAGVEIVPIAIEGSRLAQPKKSFFINPSRVKIKYGNPIPVKDYSIDELRAVVMNTTTELHKKIIREIIAKRKND